MGLSIGVAFLGFYSIWGINGVPLFWEMPIRGRPLWEKAPSGEGSLWGIGFRVAGPRFKVPGVGACVRFYRV